MENIILIIPAVMLIGGFVGFIVDAFQGFPERRAHYLPRQQSFDFEV